MKIGHLTNPAEMIEDYSAVSELPNPSKEYDGIASVSYTTEEHYSIATSPVDSSFCNNFKAISRKRFQLLNNWQTFIYECLLPSILMIIGISLTSIDFFARSPTRILDPSRVTIDNLETLIFDIGIDMDLIPEVEPVMLNEEIGTPEPEAEAEENVISEPEAET
jgi:hypothetical protein